MEFGIGQILTLVGSLGIFLYGMKVMSEGLQKIAGDKMRHFLSIMTGNRILGVFTGILITVLVQSSSATTLMVVSFANAGLVSLAQAVSVIMGANVGTTITAWLISLFGFKIDISTFAVPLVALSIPLIFSSKSKRKSWGEFIIGFSLLFIGLQFLKTNVPDLKNSPEALAFLQQYAHGGYGSILIFLIVGTVLTVIVQSSSATVAITLIMCANGWIPFHLAAAMVLGENIGTTITANLAAIGANVTARRAAIAHLLFNIFGVLWCLAIFFPYLNLVSNIIEHTGVGEPTALYEFIAQRSPEELKMMEETPEANAEIKQWVEQRNAGINSVSFALSLFHTMFNVTNILIMIWFVRGYVYVCSKVIPEKKNKKSKGEEFQLRYISYGLLSTAELSLAQAKKEVAVFGERTSRMLEMAQDMMQTEDPEKAAELYNRIEKYENICDRMELEIANYVSQVSEGRLSADSKEEIRVTLRAVSEIESIGDACFNIAKGIRRMIDNKAQFTEQMKKNIFHIMALNQKAMEQMNYILGKDEHEPEDALESYNIENAINNFRDDLRNSYADSVSSKHYSYSDGVYYHDIINECESLGDYIINVVQAVVERRF